MSKFHVKNRQNLPQKLKCSFNLEISRFNVKSSPLYLKPLCLRSLHFDLFNFTSEYRNLAFLNWTSVSQNFTLRN